MSVLANDSFETGVTRKTHTGQEFGEIFVPEYWTAYWREGGSVPHDHSNQDGYGRPETHVINREPPYLDPLRIRSGHRAFKLFTFFRIHDAGLYQRVEGLEPGTRLRASAWAHAWSSNRDNPHVSDGVGDDAFWALGGALDPEDPEYGNKLNFTFAVGIDPTGKTNPWSERVVWGDGAHIYNAYGEIPAIEVEAEADAVTVFLRSTVLWPFKHCDAYFDDASLEIVDEPAPIEQYDRHVIIADPNYMNEAQLDAAYSRGREQLNTVTPAWTDAVLPAENRPAEWATNTVDAGPLPAGDRPRYEAWVADRDPETELVYQEVAAPPAIVNYSQRDARWADDPLGSSTHTLGQSGCAVTAFASLASQHDPDLTPGTLNAWLRENRGYVNDGLLVWRKAADRVDQLEFVTYHTWREPGQVADMDTVRRVLALGPAIIQVDFYPGDPLNSHFVLALEIQDGDVLIMDPWTGTRRKLLDAYGPGRSLASAIFALAEFREVEGAPAPMPQTRTRLGFNDWPGPHGTGTDWMLENDLAGFIVRPVFLGETARSFDYGAAERAGIRVILNLRYSWSTDEHGAGTIPVLDTDPWTRFVYAAAKTMQSSRGVWGWTVANEPNNPREFPHGRRLTPWHIIRTYNVIRELAGGDFRMAPGALDPYHASEGDPRDWLAMIWARISGAEFVPVHGYIRGPDPDLVGSDARFTDAPLLWQKLNYQGCITAFLEALPIRYRDLDVYVTEFNHLWRTNEQAGDVGWVADDRAAQVIRAAYDAAVEEGFAGLAIYRWAGDAWAVHDNEAVKRAVADILS